EIMSPERQITRMQRLLAVDMEYEIAVAVDMVVFHQGRSKIAASVGRYANFDLAIRPTEERVFNVELLRAVGRGDVDIDAAGDVLKIAPQLGSQIVIEDVRDNRDPLSGALIFADIGKRHRETRLDPGRSRSRTSSRGPESGVGLEPSSLPAAMEQVMHKGVLPAPGDVGVCLQVGMSVKVWPRRATFRRPVRQIMPYRVHSAGRDIRVAGEVPRRVEQRRRGDQPILRGEGSKLFPPL